MNSTSKNDKTNYQQFTDLLKTDKPDERQIMTYVSCFYHAFQGAMQVNVKSLKMTNSFFFYLNNFRDYKVETVL